MPRPKESMHKIRTVEPGSIAEEYGIEAGDCLLSVNGTVVEDVFDYRYLIREDVVTLVVRKGTHSEEFLEMHLPEDEPEDWELEIEKDPSEDLGIEFESGLMDEYRSCRNHCVFCFIDQMPEGMRDTLYFHDDDARLSFLQGNYITLTNMSDHDIDRIIRYHLEPINISFHTMNPKLRCQMLHNRFAGDVFPKITRLKEAGIELNGQIVLCKGINDAEELDYSLGAFEQYLPELKSVSVVPVGLTKYRDHLPKLESFGSEDAGAVIDQIGRWQDYYMEHYGTHLVHASDEWYILAGRELPEEECYDGYLQLENGVGMVRLLMDQVRETLRQCQDSGLQQSSIEHMENCSQEESSIEHMEDCSQEESAADNSSEECPPGVNEKTNKNRHVTIATGVLAAPILKMLCDEITSVFSHVRSDVVPIINEFFGEKITVSGLITGRDLTRQLSGLDLGDYLLLPINMLRSNENVLLDDMTVEEIEETLQTKVIIVESDGQSLVRAVTGYALD